ncbi:DHH family phosphoesterase [Erysipelothrix urinaevulpis]|uniref:single-stranded-DNA-specific exonuclease RecJ n=1 Tax=Erysipelothrix urinaevulpis TaxID=2683717 RepID=UPI00135AEB44|nr:DHH family phosphoesterase [Erysipelothrix urinaevulpis]
MHHKIMNEILEYWNLSDEQKDEIINPKIKVYKHEGFELFMKNANRLMVCGDYDCDGVTSTSIALLLAQQLKIEAGFYIPNRLTQGYGLSLETVDLAYEKGYTDLLLVDNGVKAIEAIDKALAYGMNVAVVDHHLMDQDLPNDVVFVHPDLIEDDYFSTMSAGGLMFALAEGMSLDNEYMEALGALATVADVMPLWGKNREIVRRGVDALNKNQFLQFDALVKRSRYTQYTAEFLAFQVSPKINSIGRMADKVNINTAVSYFLSDSQAQIKSYAAQVLEVNSYRKQLGAHYQKDARTKINQHDIQIISSTSYHEGLLGIIANHISQETGKPSIVLREYDDVYKGSARSGNISLESLFSQLNPNYFIAMGGHDFAYGMTIKKEYYDNFENDLYSMIQKTDPTTQEFDGITVDYTELTRDLIRLLKQYEPLGEGIKIPLMRMNLPQTYKLVRLNGHGYKLLFNDGTLDEALLFTKTINEYEISQSKSISFKLNLQDQNKFTIYIEELFDTVVR